MSDDYGIKYSIPKNDLKNNDPDKRGFDSGYNSIKAYSSGIVSKLASHGALTQVQVAHGLGYRPAFNAYFRDTLTGEVYQVSSGFDNVQFNRNGSEISVHASSDNYNLTFNIWNDNSTTDKNVDIFYEIFYEDLTTQPATIVG